MFDQNNSNEVKIFFKKEFDSFTGLSYDGIQIETGKFVIDWGKISCCQYVKNLILSVYPLLEKKLQDRWYPNDYLAFRKKLNISASRVFLKYQLNLIARTSPLQLEIFTPNLTIFKNRESHKFFDFLFNDWLKDIENCRPQLSYIVWAMRREKSEDVINDFAITCPSLKDFADFWNSYSHPFKLTYKKSKLNLSDEPSEKHKAAFDNRKQEFINIMM